MQGERVPEKPRLSDRDRRRWHRRITFYAQEAKIYADEGDEKRALIYRQGIESAKQWIDEP
jgi:hypothetical protein